MICRSAPAGGCVEPSELECVFIDCPNCRDGSCGHCEDGEIILKHCPCPSIPRYIFTMIEMAELAEEKIGLPVAGGVLDQTQAFIDSLRFVNAEHQRCKNHIANQRR